MKDTLTTERAPRTGQSATTRRGAYLLDRLLLPLLVGLAALLPRCLGLADFFTTDEVYHWVSRTERFAAAVGAGRWADTILTGHPGVTLMWLGSFGQSLERLAAGAGWVAWPDSLEHLAWLRLGPVLAHAVALIGGYALLRRLVRPGLALVAALLWATSPFLVAQGRLLHLDALLTDCCTLTLLCTLVACHAERPRPWLIAAGVLCGLALLTKGPALIVLPVLGLTLFALGGDRRTPRVPVSPTPRVPVSPSSLIPRLTWSVPRYLLILAVAAATVFLLWPALWAAPDRAVGRYVDEIVTNGGRANGDGQFFLGRSDADPGLLFYPLAGLYRLTPLELLGLVLLPLTFWGWTRARSPDPLVRRERATLLALGAFALFWVIVMSVGPKKFDRYVLPIWPALLTLSAAGLLMAWGWLRARWRNRATGAVAVALLLAFQGGTLAWYHPYYLSYFNPVLGGSAAAQRLFLIGWGEGMDQVGAWLRERPDIQHGQILSALPETLAPFVPVPVREVRAIDAVIANYAVVYLESLQRNDAPEIYARIRATVPLHTVTIHGIPYAQIYQLARPYTTPVNAEFGGAIGLLGYSASQTGGILTVTPAWDTRSPVAKDLTLFLFVFDAAGTKVAQIDVPPGGVSVKPTSQWQPGEQYGVPLPVPLPAGLPAGTYTLALGLYAPDTGARVPRSAGPAADRERAGPDAVLLGSVTLTTP